ncbi:hypothetical protein EW145_g2771 [Phellinidium pouzarii]|uniref:Uncharacterized protein n=1 Tax=Phellinidium pouzarii TaxID=167371 RepID=A0A4S4L9J3_9AGAM|nr:hypothetical protein EW145_g2771 [Phellinidium pouzarii]
MVPGEFEEAEDDLWTHLAHIRDLQSEIAKMHSHMEGLGENERLHRPDQTVDDDTAYAEEGKAAEFAKLSDRFNGRKDAIDAIMLKLETLSRAINDFHSSRAPFFRFTSISNQHMGAVKSDMEAKTPGDVNSQQPLTRFLSESHDNLILKGSPDSALPSLFDSDNSNP